MIQFARLITYLVLAFNLISCSSHLTKEELQNINRVGIVNNFPEFPSYIVIGTTIFNNEYGIINDKKFHDKFSEVATNYLTKKNYKVSAIPDKDKETKNVDLILVFKPLDIYQMPGTSYGYGLNQRSMFGNAMAPNVYVSFNVFLYLNGEYTGNSFYTKALTILPLGDLPLKWDDLSVDNKKLVTENLNKAIDESVTQILIETGI